MSLLLFKDRVLYADRSGLEIIPKQHRFVEMEKLFISKDKTFALATTGKQIDFNSQFFKAFERELKKKLLMLEGFEQANSKITIAQPYNNNGFIVITSRRAYLIQTPEETTDTEIEITGLDPNITRIEGSGTKIASALITVGKTPEETFTYAAKHCASMFPTQVDSVSMDSLTPIVNMESKKK